MSVKFNQNEIPWIPWKRFAVVMRIDGGKPFIVDRHGRRESAFEEAETLDQYKGYSVRVFDTREKKFLRWWDKTITAKEQEIS